MKTLKALLYFILISVLAAGIAWHSCLNAVSEYDAYIRGELAAHGIGVNDVGYDKDTLFLSLNANGEAVSPDDIMNIRKTLNALRDAVFDEHIYHIRLVSPSGNVVYSDIFYNIYNDSETVLYEYSGGSLDEVMKKYLLKYDFNKKGYTCSYISFYDTTGMTDPALYVELDIPPSKLSAAITDFIGSVTALNERGSSIFRYSAAFYDDGEIMAVVSRDIVYGDVIYWKAPAYEAIKTMFG